MSQHITSFTSQNSEQLDTKNRNGEENEKSFDWILPFVSHIQSSEDQTLYRRGSVKLILSLSAKKEGFLFPAETLNISFSTEHSEIFFSVAMNTKKIVTNVQFL